MADDPEYLGRHLLPEWELNSDYHLLRTLEGTHKPLSGNQGSPALDSCKDRC